MKSKIEVKINTKKCVGCGMCVNMCPRVFELKNGKSSVKEEVNLERNKECIIQAENLCPMKAIEIK